MSKIEEIEQYKLQNFNEKKEEDDVDEMIKNFRNQILNKENAFNTNVDKTKSENKDKIKDKIKINKNVKTIVPKEKYIIKKLDQNNIKLKSEFVQVE
jgi:hypothetical protein